MLNKKQVQRFSIRKLTVGATSVLIGVAFLGMSNANNAKADVMTPNQVQTEDEQQSNQKEIDTENISEQHLQIKPINQIEREKETLVDNTDKVKNAEIPVVQTNNVKSDDKKVKNTLSENDKKEETSEVIVNTKDELKDDNSEQNVKTGKLKANSLTVQGDDKALLANGLKDSKIAANKLYADTTNVNVKLCDKDETIESITLTGRIGTDIDLSKVKIPANYKVDGELPTGKYGYGSANLHINLKHELRLATENDIDPKTGKPLVLQVDREYKFIEHLPNSSVETVVKKLHFYRDTPTVDMVTGQINYSSWDLSDEDTNFAEKIKYESIQGYYGKLTTPNSVLKTLHGHLITNGGDESNIYLGDNLLNGDTAYVLQITHDMGDLTVVKGGYGTALVETKDGVRFVSALLSSANTSDDITSFLTELPASQIFNIKYFPDSQINSYIFVDDDNNGKQVGKAVKIKGYTDETVKFTYIAPENYVLVANQPTEYKFKGGGNEPIEIHLKHKIGIIDENNIPKNTSLTMKAFEKTVTRSVTINKPDHKGGVVSEYYNKAIKFTRTANYDQVNGNVMKWNDWSTKDKFKEIEIPDITGYTSSQSNVVEEIPTADYQDPKIIVNYAANPAQAHISYYDDDLKKEIDHADAEGKFDDVIKFKNDKNEVINPDDKIAELENKGYVFDRVERKDKNDQQSNPMFMSLFAIPSRFGQKKYDRDDSPINFIVHFTHGKKTIDKDNIPGKNPREKAPIDENKSGDHKVNKDDLDKFITRTITVIEPDGTKENKSQTLEFERTAKVDSVTDKVIEYGKWTPISGSNQYFEEFTPDHIDGYAVKIDGKSIDSIPELDLTDDNISNWNDENNKHTAEYVSLNQPDSNGSSENIDNNSTQGSESMSLDNHDEVLNTDNNSSAQALNNSDHQEFQNEDNSDKESIEKNHVYKDAVNKVDNIKTTNSVQNKKKNGIKIAAAVKNNKNTGKRILGTKVEGAAKLENIESNKSNSQVLPQTGEKQNEAILIGLALATVAGLLGLGMNRRKNK